MNTSPAVGPRLRLQSRQPLRQPLRRLLRWHALPVLAAACALAGVPGAAHATPSSALVLCYEDVAQRPWTTPSGGGLNFELLRRVEKQLGERFSYVAKPWRRCLEELRTGALAPSRAVGSDYAHVFLRTAGAASWDGKQLVAPNNEVAVQSGYIVGTVLRERGYRVCELVKSADDGCSIAPEC